MGLFSGKDVTTVGTNISRVISDALIPDSIKSGAIKGIFADGNLAEYVMEELTSSIALRAEQLYNYAETKYVYGSPSGDMYSNTQGRKEVQAVLQSLFGDAVSLDYCHFAPPNDLHLGWMKLIDAYGYSPETNQLSFLTAEKKTPVYLSDITVVVPAARYATYTADNLIQWGNPPAANNTGAESNTIQLIKPVMEHTPIQSSTVSAVTELHIEYQWYEQKAVWNDEAITLPRKDKLVFSIPSLDVNDEYFHAKYSINDQSYYWMYKVGSGTYPSLDAVFDDPAPVIGNFFPFAYFRYGKVAMNTDTDSTSYKSSKKLLKYLGMDFNSITKAIHENPGIGDVEQAMLMMAVPANTTNQMEQRYLFDFFDNLYYSGPEQYSSPVLATVNRFFNRETEVSKNAIVIKDKLFKLALSNEGIFKKRKVGQLGKKGSVTTGTYTTKRKENYINRDNDGESVETRTITEVFHYYRKQISDVLYDEVLVLNLKTVYYIWGGYNVIGDGDEPILLVPLDHSITQDYNIPEREELYARSLHFVFNSRTTVHLKWYQTSFFSDLIKIGAIVLAVISLQPEFVEIAMMAIAVEAGTMTLMAFAWAITTMYIIPFVVSTLVVKYFIKVAGAEVAFLVAVVAAAYGIVKAVEFKSLAGAPWAKELIGLSTNLTKGISDAMGDALLGLKSEAEAFGLKIKEETKLLDKLTDLLNEDNHMTTLFIPGEIPTDFFNRTIHSGNIGIQSIEAITSYVDIALTLPKIQHTLGASYGSV